MVSRGLEGIVPMDSSKIKVAVAVIALGAAGFLAWRQFQAEATDDVRDLSSTFLCEDCKSIFDKTQRELQALPSQDGHPPCPTCGKTNTADVFRCPNCAKAIFPVGHGSIPPICPHCKKKT